MICRWFATALVLVVLPALAGLAADDPFGDPIPEGARVRLGTARMRRSVIGDPTVFTPNGKYLASSANRGEVTLVDVASGKVVRTPPIIGSFGATRAFSADGKRGFYSSSQEAIVYDTQSGKALANIRHDANISYSYSAGSLSSDGKYLAFGSLYDFSNKKRDKPLTAVVWDVDANKLRTTVMPPQNESVYAVISPDGKWLATWGSHSRGEGKEGPEPEPNPAFLMQFWDASTGKEVGRSQSNRGYRESVAFSPDGSLLATSTREGTIDLFDPSTGESKGSLLGRAGQGRRLAFSPDGKTLASSDGAGSIQRWSVAERKRLSVTEPPMSLDYMGLRAIQYADNERIVAWGWANRGKVAVVWEAPSGKLLSTAGGHFDDVTCVAVVGKEIYTGGRDGIIRWDSATAKELGRVGLKLPTARFGETNAAPEAISADGKWALSHETGGVGVYELPTGIQQFLIPSDSDRRGRGAFTSDSSKLVQIIPATKDSPIRVAVWDIASAKKLGGVKLPGAGAVSAALTPNGKTLVTAGMKDNEKEREFVVTGWELASGKKLGEYFYQESSAFGESAVVAAGDNRSAVVRTPRGEIMVVDFVAGEKRRDLDLGREGRRLADAIVASPDGKKIALAIDPTYEDNATSNILLCAIGSGKLEKRLTGASSVIALAFSPDGKSLVAGFSDTTALVWDISGR
jgi:WD40 repeat protein